MTDIAMGDLRVQEKGLQPPMIGRVSYASSIRSVSDCGAPLVEQIGEPENHRRFCELVGITEVRYEAEEPNLSRWWYGKQRKCQKKNGKPTGLYPRVVTAYKWNTIQYILIAVLMNCLLWTQIIFGAALAALGGSTLLTDTKRASIIVTSLGALQTVFGGLITYFKSRNQPNRARQYRANLRKMKEEIENAECVFRSNTYEFRIPTVDSHGVQGTMALCVDEVVRRLMARYEAVIKDAEANYPDYWTASDRKGTTEEMIINKKSVVATTTAAPVPAPIPSPIPSPAPSLVPSPALAPVMLGEELIKDTASMISLQSSCGELARPARPVSPIPRILTTSTV